MKYPLVSVVVPTRNEANNIANCLDSVKNQSYPPKKIEIILVDNFSTDKTISIGGKYSTHIFSKGPERSSQRNFGALHSKGKYIFFLDADMRLQKNMLQECVLKMESTQALVGLYTPEIIIGPSLWVKARQFERSFYNETPIDAVRFIDRKALFQVNGFDEKLQAFEDWDLNKKLSQIGKFSTIESAVYHDERNFSIVNYLKKKWRYTKYLKLYKEKWKTDDSDIKKQFNFRYRFIDLYFQHGKWKKIFKNPTKSIIMYFLKFLVLFVTGVSYITSHESYTRSQ